MKSSQGCQKLVEVSTPCLDDVTNPYKSTGAWSEYAKCDEQFVALKPRNLSLGDSAALPLAAMTALQVLRKYDGSLEGKTVFIPAGCKLKLQLMMRDFVH